MSMCTAAGDASAELTWFSRTKLIRPTWLVRPNQVGSDELATSQLGPLVFVFVENVHVEHGVSTGKLCMVHKLIPFAPKLTPVNR